MRKSVIRERRALSAARPVWQSRAGAGSGLRMKKLVALAFLAVTASPAMAVSGEIGTMPIGRYICELPGDALGPAGLHVPSADFQIKQASRYKTDRGNGNYLLVDDLLIMTSGPRDGEQYIRKTHGLVRRLAPDGTPSTLRCVLRTRNNR